MQGEMPFMKILTGSLYFVLINFLPRYVSENQL